MVIGEWGAYYELKGTLPAAQEMMELIQKYEYGAFYWDYRRDITSIPVFPALVKQAAPQN